MVRWFYNIASSLVPTWVSFLFFFFGLFIYFYLFLTFKNQSAREDRQTGWTDTSTRPIITLFHLEQTHQHRHLRLADRRTQRMRLVEFLSYKVGDRALNSEGKRRDAVVERPRRYRVRWNQQKQRIIVWWGLSISMIREMRAFHSSSLVVFSY